MDFAKVFEYVTLPLSIAEADYPNNLVYVNKAFCDLTGYSPEELLEKNPGKLLQGDSPTNKRKYMREKLNNYEPIDVLIKNYRKDGSWFWNGLHIHPVIENGICLYWVGRATDVTNYVENVNTGLEAIASTLKDSFHQMKTDLNAS